MSRVLALVGALASTVVLAASAQAAIPKSIGALESALQSHRTTCVAVTRQALAAIRAGRSLRAVFEINPDALSIARRLDARQRSGRPLLPLQCLPLLVKENYETRDLLQTTVGSVTMLGFHAPKDAYVVARLRAAGAVELGKTNMDEWAHGATGYSSAGGQTLNAARTTRIPGGSSGGSASAVAAGMALLATGSDTGGSIQIPAAYTGVVGLRPTIGLISRGGIAPYSSLTDTPGPLTRSVADAARVLGTMTGVDPADPDTFKSRGHFFRNYTRFLQPNGLRGARIGVLSRALGQPLRGFNTAYDRAFDAAIRLMRAKGATIVELPPLQGKLKISDLLATERQFPPELDHWLATDARTAPVHSLQEIIAKSSDPPVRVLATLQASAKLPPPHGRSFDAQVAALRRIRTSTVQMIHRYRLTAIAFEATSCTAPPIPGIIDRSWHCKGAPRQPLKWKQGGGSIGPILSPITGLPVLTIPTGRLPDDLPASINLLGPAWSEGPLLRLGFAFEQRGRPAGGRG
jgi:amidase